MDDGQRRLGLRRLQLRRREIRVGLRQGGIDPDQHRQQRAALDEATDDGFRHLSDARQIAHQPLPAIEPRQRLHPRRGQPRRHRAAGAIFHDLARRQERHRWPDHADDPGERTEIIIRHPFAQPSHRGRQGRNIEHRRQRAKALCLDFAAFQPAGIPHHPGDGARTERHGYRHARRSHHPRRHGIIERPQPMLENDDTDRHDITHARHVMRVCPSRQGRGE